MQKLLQRIFVQLPILVAAITVIGTLLTATTVTIKLLSEKVLANQQTFLREFSPNEIYKLYLFDELNGNWKQFRLLSAVIQCESGWNEMAWNKKSNDFGLFQINYKTWNNKALELGLENYTDYWKDNLDMGIWIYKNSGIQNWNWSKFCWSK